METKVRDRRCSLHQTKKGHGGAGRFDYGEEEMEGFVCEGACRNLRRGTQAAAATLVPSLPVLLPVAGAADWLRYACICQPLLVPWINPRKTGMSRLPFSRQTAYFYDLNYDCNARWRSGSAEPLPARPSAS